MEPFDPHFNWNAGDESGFDILSPETLISLLAEQDVNTSSTPTAQDGSKPPKISRNDIRRFLPKMLMNAWNSGDWRQAQEVFSTFITEQCSFVSFHKVSSLLGIPPQICTTGSLQFNHYVLGCMIMFPDLVASVLQSEIIITPGSPNSVLRIDAEYKFTKASHIPTSLWIPPIDLIPSLNQARSGWELLHIDSHPQFFRTSSWSSNLSAEGIFSSSSSDVGDANMRHITPAWVASSSSSSASISASASTMSLPSVAPDSTTTAATTTAAAAAITATSTTSTSKTIHSKGRASSDGTKPSKLQGGSATTKISEAFARNLQEISTPVITPIPATFFGQVDFELDPSNRIVSIRQSLWQ